MEIMDVSTFAESLTDEQRLFLMDIVAEHSIIAIKQGFQLKTAIADDENSSGSDVVAASINAAIANRLCEICDVENTFKDILDEIIELAAELY